MWIIAPILVSLFRSNIKFFGLENINPRNLFHNVLHSSKAISLKKSLIYGLDNFEI